MEWSLHTQSPKLPYASVSVKHLSSCKNPWLYESEVLRLVLCTDPQFGQCPWACHVPHDMAGFCWEPSAKAPAIMATEPCHMLKSSYRAMQGWSQVAEYSTTAHMLCTLLLHEVKLFKEIENIFTSSGRESVCQAVRSQTLGFWRFHSISSFPASALLRIMTHCGMACYKIVPVL